MAESIDAATVILVRAGQPVGAPWECYMVRRAVQSDFGSVYVFPGGKVDEADRDPGLARLVEGHQGAEVSADDRGAEWTALKLAAIRELFEEVGILLARHADGWPLRISEQDATRFAAYRQALEMGEIGLREIAESEDLRFVGDRLHPFSRWITPEAYPRRYDTRFFVAELPAHQEPVRTGRETTDHLWISPREAVQLYRDGAFPLVFPTLKHLERLAQYRSIEQLIAATAAADLEPVVPRLVRRNGEEVFLLPGEEG